MTHKRRGTARWSGDLQSGQGNVTTESGALDTAYDAPSRFEQGDTTNPEELIGAAHAACFSMALANLMAEEGYEPDNIETDATVELEMQGGPKITNVHLSTRGRADGIDEETFGTLAQKAKENCPVSGALGALSIDLEATLETPTPG